MNSRLRFLPHALVLLALPSAVPAAFAADQETMVATAPTPNLTLPEVDDLLGPIALYPDALVALILPASTNPTEIVIAARYLDSGGDPNQIDNQPWSDAVKALARYPEVIKWMDTNLAWTKQLGDVFIGQEDDVMRSIQRLRGEARASGALIDTPQQQVVVEGDTIEIVPAQPDVIYVPMYDPEVVYDIPPGYYSPYPYVTFGTAFPIGLWLTYDFDWHRRRIWVGDRNHNWHNRRDWHTPGHPTPPSHDGWHSWRPPANRPRPPASVSRPQPGVIRPRPLPGTPHFAHPPRNSNDPRHGPRPGSTPPANNRPNQAPPPANAPRPVPDGGRHDNNPADRHDRDDAHPQRPVNRPPSTAELNRATPPAVIPQQRATPPAVIPQQRATPPANIPEQRATPPPPSKVVNEQRVLAPPPPGASLPPRLPPPGEVRVVPAGKEAPKVAPPPRAAPPPKEQPHREPPPRDRDENQK